jgi:hypothetical protein
MTMLSNGQEALTCERYLFVNKDLLDGLLEVNEISFWFTKQDGTDRVLRGTRNAQAIFDDARVHIADAGDRRRLMEAAGMPSQPSPADVLRVWDLDKHDWRTVRLDAINDYVVHLPDDDHEHDDGAAVIS